MPLFCKFDKKKVVKEALYYTKEAGNKVRCNLCPWYCDLKEGQIGACKVRKNNGGTLETLVYNNVAALSIDPVEKKPLYHFYPGKNILSIGNVGCNLHCTFCQNHNISQCRAEEFKYFIEFNSSELVEEAGKVTDNIGVAYTYNEPFTFFEFMLDSAKLVHKAGLKNVVVSSGYINQEPLDAIIPYIDAFNIDLKAFDDGFYRQQTQGRLKPVLQAITSISKRNVHLEITNLVIPGLNDDEILFEEMVKWLANEAGPDTPLHLSRYFPHYKLNIPPTPVDVLERLFFLASKHLRYVYIGNVTTGSMENTRCPECGKVLVQRSRYLVNSVPGFNGNCPKCGTKIPVVL